MGSNNLSGYIWLFAYFICNLTLTIYNKGLYYHSISSLVIGVMQFVGFKFPFALTGIHTCCCALGCYFSVYVLKLCRPAELGIRENLIMVAFSLLYTINIAVSNVSLNLVTVPFHQVVRATTPVFTIVISLLFLGKSYSTLTYVSLIPVVVGVGLATLGEYNYTTFGFILTLLGTLLAALKTITTNLIQVGSLKLHPLDLLLRMSPLAFIQCCFYSYMTGEMDDVVLFVNDKWDMNIASALFLNGFIAFFLNVVSFTANKKTSALTMTVAANIKQVLSIVLSVVIFELTITVMNGCGILLTLCGGAWYGYIELMDKNRKVQIETKPMVSINTDTFK